MKKYDDLLAQIIQEYTPLELTQICQTLNRCYNIYDSEDYRWSQIEYSLPKTKDETIAELKQNHLSNKVINDLIMRFYPCERVVKYYLIKHLMPLSNHIVAFEMCIGNSRVDICRINGGSYAYEIKTEFDSFERLESQMSDYMDAFEKVYLVVPKSRVADALRNIPANCGLITYDIQHSTVKFNYKKKAIKNACNIDKCANSLSSNDLLELLRFLGVQDFPSLKNDRLQLALTTPSTRFWSAYKHVLKTKYQNKWNFLIEHFDDILPIDVQNFFSTSIDPSLTYSKRTEEQL